jgi:hypothetical protein
MTNFKNGQAVLCPSLSTKLLYAYHCKTANGMWVVDNRSQIKDQIHHRRRFNNNGCRKETTFPTLDNSCNLYNAIPQVFPATEEAIKALQLLGFTLDIEAVEKELAEKWTIGTEVLSLHVEGCEENDVIYRFIDESTIEFVGPHGELYTTHYKSLKV